MNFRLSFFLPHTAPNTENIHQVIEGNLRTTLAHLDYYLPILLDDMTKRGYVIQDNKKFYLPDSSVPVTSRQSRSSRKKKSIVRFSPSTLSPPGRSPITPGISAPNLRREYAEEDYHRRPSPSRNGSGTNSDYDPNKKFTRKGCRTKLPRHRTASTKNNLQIKPRRARKKPVLLDVNYKRSRSRSSRSRHDEMEEDDEYYNDEGPGTARVNSEYNKYRYTYT